MSIKKDAIYQEEYNCKVSDLVNDVPPNTDSNGNDFEESSKMYVWTDDTNKLVSIFKMIFGEWHKF